MAARYPYQQQYETTARLIAERVRARTGLPLPAATVYQSRSGRPEDPWLGPDVCDFLREQRAAGQLDAAVVVPAGFICDHIEVLYDLDTEAAAVCRGARRADGAGARGQRSSRLPRHDGGRGPSDGRTIRRSVAPLALPAAAAGEPESDRVRPGSDRAV